jgi:hypothetical protein
MIEEKELVELSFKQGKNNVAPETEQPSDSARELLNVDLSNSGGVSLRRGYEKVYDAGSDSVHSLFSSKKHTVFVQGSNLMELNTDYTANALIAVDPNSMMSYAEINNRIYFSNGVDTGVVNEDGTMSEWGVKSPSGQPLLTLNPLGDLWAGTYQVAITFVAADGEESGAALADTIEVPAGNGITCSLFPTDPDAAFINIYLTAPNGTTLYHRAKVPMGTVNVDFITNPPNYGKQLETQFMEQMPPGHIVRYFKGHMWVAIDDVLVFSQPLRYGLYDPRHDYFRFPSKITIVQRVEDGVYVVADQTYFLAGNDPKQMQQRVVYSEGAVEETGLNVPPTMIKEDQFDTIPDYLAFWYSVKGAVLGLPGGQVQTITEDRMDIPEFGYGASLLRNERGIRQLVTSLSNRGNASGFGASDHATAEVRRNGVLISDFYPVDGWSGGPHCTTP